MKISERTHPALGYLASGFIYGIRVPVAFDKNLLNKIGETFEQLCSKFQKVIVLTDPFEDAIFKARQKLHTEVVIDEISKEDRYGTMVCGKVVLCYFFSKKSTYLFSFQNDHLVAFVSKDNSNEITENVEWYHPDNPHNDLGAIYINRIIEAIGFILFAETETKIIDSGKKILGFNCKYVNHSKLTITVMDSKWFTTLVKSDAFKVRGHFRFQPHGDGMKDRKLIWISDFEKTGYTAPARKLSQPGFM